MHEDIPALLGQLLDDAIRIAAADANRIRARVREQPIEVSPPAAQPTTSTVEEDARHAEEVDALQWDFPKSAYRLADPAVPQSEGLQTLDMEERQPGSDNPGEDGSYPATPELRLHRLGGHLVLDGRVQRNRLTPRELRKLE